MSGVVVRALRAEDRAAWSRLYRGYAAFYEQPKDDAALDALWARILGPDADVEAFVAVPAAGEPVGLAHVREFARPLDGSRGLYLDDLFVAPEQRGAGVARTLLEHLAVLAGERGASVVRWVTREDNRRARRLYDAVARPTPFVTYDMAPRPPAG